MLNDQKGLMQIEKALQDAMADAAVAQGKFEIAADILHDISNAVVGFGSYLARIRRSLEQNGVDNLLNLADFFEKRHVPLKDAIGEDKAAAVVSMLRSIADSQRVNGEEIQKSITEQLHIITHIQEILNIQRQYVAGQETSGKKPANLRTIVNDCLSMLFASIDKRGIQVSLDLTVASTVVFGDRTKLMQVVMNILKNSIEAIDAGATEKTISICLRAEEDLLVLEIRDSGTGFDEATGALIFGRGFTTKSSGTGLGMSNCRSILDNHGGNISITSDGPGKGALTSIQFII